MNVLATIDLPDADFDGTGWGIDGCRSGWLVAGLRLTDNRHQLILGEAGTLQAVLDYVQEKTRIYIDMPIGLMSSGEGRRCDQEARSLLKGKASSVFSAPCRQVLTAETYDEANKRNRSNLGKGLSKQSWYLVSKILELDLLLQDKTKSGLYEWRDLLFESHPELNFMSLNSEPVIESKKTEEGRNKRIALLSEQLDPRKRFAFLKDVFDHAHTRRFASDDVLDAIVLAWAAVHHQSNTFLPVKAAKEEDSTGLRMAIACL